MILYLLNEYGFMSRKDIASKLSLTPAAVTKICSELIDEGFIEEVGTVEEKGRSGRREILLALRLRDKSVLCINAEKSGVTYSLSTLDGELIKLKKTPFLNSCDDAVENAQEFLYSLDSAEREKIIGAGVCIIGSQNENDFGVWKDGGLKEKFENALDMPVVIENNVKAFAQSELIYGKKELSKSVLFLKWGPGIGSSIAANGEIQTGNDSGIAEIGHYIVNRGGKKCRCGRFGCLETEVSSEVIIQQAGGESTIEEILKSDDPDIVHLLEEKIDTVALALTNTATILNAESIILFGGVFDSEAVIRKLIHQCVRYNKNFSEDIIKVSSLNSRREYIGAAAICAKEYFFDCRLGKEKI